MIAQGILVEQDGCFAVEVTKLWSNNAVLASSILVLFLLIVLLMFIIPCQLVRKEIKDGNKLKIKEKVYLDNSTKIYVLDYEGRKLFIASNSSSISISVDNIDQGKKK